MLGLLVTLVGVLLGSALCSATEVALLSISPLRLRQLAAQNHRQAMLVLTIREQISRPIAAIVILNNLFNIVGSVLMGRQAAGLFPAWGVGLFSAVLTLLIITLAEIIPKTLGERFADPLALWLATPVYLLTWLLTPLIVAIERLMAPWIRRDPHPTTSETEIQLLAQIAHQEGVIEDDELLMIQRVFQLNDLRAADVMTPRVAMTYVEGSLTLAACQELILGSQHTRIVVIGEDIDHVVGIALKQELLAALVRQQGERLIQSFCRPALFVPEVARLDHVLRRLQDNHEHLAVVVDEYGGVSGVVSLEDVLEVLTGEIVDETDRVTDMQALARLRLQQLLAKNYLSLS